MRGSLALGSFFVFLAGCGAFAADRPNFLVIVSDDLRADAVASFGNPHLRTPHLDRLAAGGMVFSRAVCSYPICVVSRSEMLTGRHGWENGVDGMTGRNFREGQTFWAGALRETGYETWHVGKWHIPGRPRERGYTEVAGLFAGGGGKFWKEGQTDARGFPITGYRGWIFQSDDGKTLFPEFGVGLTPDISTRIGEIASSLVRRAGEKPWFCHVNFTAPHDPLLPPTGMEGKYDADEIPLPVDFLTEHPFDHGNLGGRDEQLLPQPRTEKAVKELLRDYYAVVEGMDRAIGQLLAALEESGQRENTYVVFTSDHGLACGSHGLAGKQNQYEHTVNVPLIIAGPGIAAGEKSEAQVYLRELYPTTCELAGVPLPETVTAKSFAPVLRGEIDSHHEDIFGYYTDTQRMLRTSDGWKLIFYPKAARWQLFDLGADPNELHNLAAGGEETIHPRFAELKEKLERWRIAAGDPLLQ